MNDSNDKLARSIGFELIGNELGRDLKESLHQILNDGSVILRGIDPLLIFQSILNESLRTIETDQRSFLFQRLLTQGPYELAGEIPPELKSKRLTDDETFSAIRFIYNRVINQFQGAVSELLAVAPCLSLINKLKVDGDIPKDSKLFVGDLVMVKAMQKKGYVSGSDMHLLQFDSNPNGNKMVKIAGLVEVKSYSASQKRLLKQCVKQLERASSGMRILGKEYLSESIDGSASNFENILKITVVPSTWKLPRNFHFEDKSLIVDQVNVPTKLPIYKQVNDREWRIILRWSHEALAQAAFEMTFWYMGKVGERAYKDNVPPEWTDFTPAEAGRNAIKMMLYYSLLRWRTPWEAQRTIALYNSYSFGYSLGMNFRNQDGKRVMMWPEDLHEIALFGKTNHNCTIR